MTAKELFDLFASPTARVALVADLARGAADDDERPIDRPCGRCGRHFVSGVFLIVDDSVVEITCAECDGRPA